MPMGNVTPDEIATLNQSIKHQIGLGTWPDVTIGIMLKYDEHPLGEFDASIWPNGVDAVQIVRLYTAVRRGKLALILTPMGE